MSSTGLGNPPPPPPPPPPPSLRTSSQGRNRNLNRQISDDRHKESDSDYVQSSVEYPEKQSVASLRSTIQTKLKSNGSRTGSQITTMPNDNEKVTIFLFACLPVSVDIKILFSSLIMKYQLFTKNNR